MEISDEFDDDDIFRRGPELLLEFFLALLGLVFCLSKSIVKAFKAKPNIHLISAYLCSSSLFHF